MRRTFENILTMRTYLLYVQAGEDGMSGQEGPLSLLAFMLPSAGWHLPNFMSPSQLYNKERIWAAMQPALGGRENERVGGGGGR